MKKVKGLRRTIWLLQNSHGDIKYSIGNIVNSMLITMHGVRWVRDLQDDHSISYIMYNHWGIRLKRNTVCQLKYKK